MPSPNSHSCYTELENLLKYRGALPEVQIYNPIKTSASKINLVAGYNGYEKQGFVDELISYNCKYFDIDVFENISLLTESCHQWPAFKSFFALHDVDCDYIRNASVEERERLQLECFMDLIDGKLEGYYIDDMKIIDSMQLIKNFELYDHEYNVRHNNPKLGLYQLLPFIVSDTKVDTEKLMAEIDPTTQYAESLRRQILSATHFNSQHERFKMFASQHKISCINISGVTMFGR
jgi:hypothetical protein